MKIAVIGAGAMGSLYGGYLSKVIPEVYLVDIWKEHIEEINKNGLIIEDNKENLVTYPKAVNNIESIGSVDLAIVFVKSFLTGKAIDMNRRLLGPNTLVLSLQNGYGNIEEIGKYVNVNNIIAGTTAHGANVLCPGKIIHGGIGATHIGWVNNKSDERIEEVASILREAGFETIVSNNVLELIWSKLIINIGINPLTALLKVRNGELIKQQEIKDIMTLAIIEGVKVARATGVNFNEDVMINKVMEVAKATGENKSSMLQDILNNRKTEIAMINGAIVNEGVKYHIDTPVNLVLSNLVKAMENKK